MGTQMTTTNLLDCHCISDNIGNLLDAWFVFQVVEHQAGKIAMESLWGVGKICRETAIMKYKTPLCLQFVDAPDRLQQALLQTGTFSGQS